MGIKKFFEKVGYLEKLLNTYILFYKKYKEVKINILEKTIEIKFIAIDDFKGSDYTQEFNILAIDERIEHYKNALKYSFSVRNKNKKL